MKVEVSVHPQGLHPLVAARAYQLRTEDDMAWGDIAGEIVNMDGVRPSLKSVRNAVARVAEQSHKPVAELGYSRCGRRRELTRKQELEIVAFVKKWRNKRFCTCAYIKRYLKLSVGKRTIARTLGRHGFHWKAVPRKTPLSERDLETRKTFVDKYRDKTASWWEANMNLALDGVTLTKAPKNFSKRQMHAVQSIGHLWLRKGESMDKDVHTFNRYGVQLGVKVPLWGGFSGGGKFVLRIWSPHPKMTKEEWKAHIPQLKQAIDNAEAMGSERQTKKAKVWQDNERFLKAPEEYRRYGLELVNFPTNSGDLNPIETVWAELRRELAKREMEDLDQGKVITVAQFRLRAAQILNSFGEIKPGKTESYLTRLVRGMPKRLAKCAANSYGRCGK